MRRCAPGERALAFRRSTAALANSSRRRSAPGRVSEGRAFAPVSSSRLPAERSYCRPTGVPEPPECEVTSPARRRRTPHRLSGRLRKTPPESKVEASYGYLPSTSRIIFRTSFRCHAASARAENVERRIRCGNKERRTKNAGSRTMNVANDRQNCCRHSYIAALFARSTAMIDVNFWRAATNCALRCQ